MQEEMKAFWETIPPKDHLTAEVQAKVSAKQEEIRGRPENKAIDDEAE